MSDTNYNAAIFAYRKAGKNGLTDDEALAAELTHQNSWRPARHKLIKEGKVIDSGKTRLTRSGRSATVYIINN